MKKKQEEEEVAAPRQFDDATSCTSCSEAALPVRPAALHAHTIMSEHPQRSSGRGGTCSTHVGGPSLIAGVSPGMTAGEIEKRMGAGRTLIPPRAPGGGGTCSSHLSDPFLTAGVRPGTLLPPSIRLEPDFDGPDSLMNVPPVESTALSDKPLTTAHQQSKLHSQHGSESTQGPRQALTFGQERPHCSEMVQPATNAVSDPQQLQLPGPYLEKRRMQYYFSQHGLTKETSDSFQRATLGRAHENRFEPLRERIAHKTDEGHSSASQHHDAELSDTDPARRLMFKVQTGEALAEEQTKMTGVLALVLSSVTLDCEADLPRGEAEMLGAALRNLLNHDGQPPALLRALLDSGREAPFECNKTDFEAIKSHIRDGLMLSFGLKPSAPRLGPGVEYFVIVGDVLPIAAQWRPYLDTSTRDCSHYALVRVHVGSSAKVLEAYGLTSSPDYHHLVGRINARAHEHMRNHPSAGVRYQDTPRCKASALYTHLRGINVEADHEQSLKLALEMLLRDGQRYLGQYGGDDDEPPSQHTTSRQHVVDSFPTAPKSKLKNALTAQLCDVKVCKYLAEWPSGQSIQRWHLEIVNSFATGKMKASIPELVHDYGAYATYDSIK